MSTATFMQKYRILNKIGEGSFSEVLKCQELKIGTYLAAKKLKKRFNSWDEVNECAEVIAMHKLPKHPNILHMTEFHFDSFLGKVTFLFELMDMSLYDFINMRKKHVHETRAKYYLYQILCGLDHLHKNGMFHRDIKPENILLKLPIDEEYESVKYETIKIADLGSLRGIYSSPPFTEYISTRWYRSPECLLTSGYYGPKMDIWATGCVFYELLTFKPLFAGANEVDQLSKIHKILGTPNKKILTKFFANKSCNYEYFPKQIGKGISYLLPNISTDGQNVMKLMITYDPEARSNVRRLLDNKYFKHLRDSDVVLRRKRSLLLEPVGDFKANNSSSGLKSQVTAKNEKRLKRSYNEIYSTRKSSPKEKIRKVDNKTPKRSYNDIIAPKKFKPSDSYKSLSKDTVEYEEPNVHRKHKLADSYKNLIRDTTEVKEPRTVFQTKHGKTTCESYDVKPNHCYALRKYVKAKKEFEAYRNTTGNIPQIFTKSPEKTKINQVSKSFVLSKNSLKYLDSDPDSTHDVMKLRPRPPKVFVLDSSVKNLRKNR